MTRIHSFRSEIKHALESQIAQMNQKIEKESYLIMDMHCHDKNSDVTDELWGRILRVPETWLSTDELINCQQRNGITAFTITNHNNARTSWELMDKGFDILPGAEFTCFFPENEIYVHVLAYGFTPEQEPVLNNLRRNIYKFLSYTVEHQIPTVLPHPLYFYKRDGQPPMDIFEKFALLFERFEVINGQRDVWQNLLTLEWIKQLDEEKIFEYSKKHNINPHDFCVYPYQKRITGGSDDHMGIFAGTCGTKMVVPDLDEKLKTQKASQLALECIRDGQLIPFGHVGDEEKLNIAILDYFCQVGLNMEDPGLVRMMLHSGTMKDKMYCLAISNGIMELKRHKYTSKFLKVFHDSLHGKRPGFIASWSVSKDYKPILDAIDEVAVARKNGRSNFQQLLKDFIPFTYNHLNGVLVKRITANIGNKAQLLVDTDMDQFVQRLEVPSHFRTFFEGSGKKNRKDMTELDIGQFFDNLTFPTLVSVVLAASTLVSTRVLYTGRNLLNKFAKSINSYSHSERILWLTDTMFDKNGVSTILQTMLREVQRLDLPIDFLVCADDVEPEDHLVVTKPIATFELKQFANQEVRVPNLLDLQQIFLNGGYDRVICSTELLMGAVSLYLRECFTVPVYFYMHTDWLDYVAKTTKLDSHGLDRIRRILRAFYKQFNGIFVLNDDHRRWLSSKSMEIESDLIFQTAHWVDAMFKPMPTEREELLPMVNDGDKVVLYAGRLSKEKGVMEIPEIARELKTLHPNTKFVFAGKGPMEMELKSQFPEGIYMGWMDPADLAKLYNMADILLLPSQFDTFGCVVLEALSCGLPVIAYNTKGPKDIVQHGFNGYLVNKAHQFISFLDAYLNDPEGAREMADNALSTAAQYKSDQILSDMMRNVRMSGYHPEADTATEMKSFYQKEKEVIME